MILKYYAGMNVEDKTGNIYYIDLSKVARVEIFQTKFGEFEKEVTKYTFELNGIDGSKISHTFAGNCHCLHYYFDYRYEVETLIDDMLHCHLTNKVSIYDIDENIKKLYLNCTGRNCTSKEWH
jgi:hypothetical protein